MPSRLFHSTRTRHYTHTIRRDARQNFGAAETISILAEVLKEMVTAVKRKSSEALPSIGEDTGGGEADGGTTGAASKKARSAESENASLVVPNDVDASKLPDGWENIVRAELKACGVGADKEYRRQLEAYDSSDDEAGEPPSPPATRTRMGAERTAKHYKVTHTVARVLVKIIDTNLEEAGMNAFRSNFTEEDDRLVEELIEKDLAESGNTRVRVRRGFWNKIIHHEHFSGRGFTAKMLESRRDNRRKRKKESEPSAKSAAKESTTAKVLESRRGRTGLASEGVSHEKFTDAEDAIIRDAATRQIQESGADKLPIGFWPSVVEAHSMRRDSQQLSKRWYILKNSVDSDAVLETSVPLQSSSERDASGNKREQKKAPLQGIFSDEVYQLIEGLVREELQQHGGERVRNGFWGRVLEKHFADHDLTTEQLRDHYKKNKRRRMTASKDLSNSNDAQEANNSRGEPFTSDEDGIVIKEAVKELRDYGKLRNGFWPKVAESYSLKRTPTQLSNRCSYLKSRGKIDLSEISSSDVGGTVTSEQLESAPTTEQETTCSDTQSHSDTVSLTDDLIIFPAYQATTTKYPPQSSVIYRPSSDKGNIVGRVMEVGIYPSQDNLYVYTISDDAGTGVQYERIPERFLEKRR